MAEIPFDLQAQFMRVFQELGIEDEGVEGIEVRFYYTEEGMDSVYARNQYDGSVDIRFTISARPDGDPDERNEA